MKPKQRDAVIEFVEQTYFGNVQNGDIDAVINCFTPDAEVIIRHGDKPVRSFAVEPRPGIDNLREFYDHLCGNYEASFGDFEHVVDTTAQRSACYFTVRLKPKADGLYADAQLQELRNCNFFDYNKGRVRFMMIYYANAGSGTETPTGYPA
ncbi:MAG: nuclear transport factor 2 family protein [Gammaproteobacteria bacterium]